MQKISVGDVQLNVLVRGSGNPLLLVHGFPLDHGMWTHQIDHFSATHRVIAPDLRGFGQSDVRPGGVTMRQYADDCAALLEALAVHEPVVFCGLSMGGYIAWQFALHHPQRLRGLVLCDTRAIADTPEAAEKRRSTADQVRAARSVEAVVESMLPKLLSDDTLTEQPALAQRLRQMMQHAPPEGVAAALVGMSQRDDVSGRLGKMDVPALVVVGEHDPISPVDEMEQIAQALPDSRWVVVPKAGHMAPLEQPEVFNNALQEFLTELEGKTGPGIIQPEEA